MRKLFQAFKREIPEHYSMIELPTIYDDLTPLQKANARHKYTKRQKNKCFYCLGSLSLDPPKNITDKPINLRKFPPGFLNHPIHLQHDHDTGLTEGAVHAYCNAVMFEYEGR